MNTRMVLRRLALGALVLAALVSANLVGAAMSSSHEPARAPAVSMMDVPF